ncbi:hypothetical protein R4Z10_11225 [Niallia sp. XMNu-256]|uniref:hypothetical protein n=1 Tax=Niallia sp. XMNu-256 TaxID=3082444 RepID=UPI0030CF0E2E
MKYEIETIYFLENPETSKTAFATGSQLQYEDTIKDVFGVACLHDLSMMIQYNKGFQTSICESYGVTENEVKLDLVLRVATKTDLLKLRSQLLETNNDQSASLNVKDSVPRPFDTMIRLQEGIFKWDDHASSYQMIKTA